MKTYTITETEIAESLIASCKVGYLSMVTPEGLPYVIPMNYGYHKGTFYLHSGPEGKKMEILRHNANVCFCIGEGDELVYQHRDVACSYSMRAKSIVCSGKIRFIEDMEEKRSCLDLFMKQYSDRPFKYSDPAVRNVILMALTPDNLCCKSFGNKPGRNEV